VAGGGCGWAEAGNVPGWGEAVDSLAGVGLRCHWLGVNKETLTVDSHAGSMGRPVSRAAGTNRTLLATPAGHKQSPLNRTHIRY